jgi:hypothetical protein
MDKSNAVDERSEAARAASALTCWPENAVVALWITIGYERNASEGWTQG